MKSTFYPFDKKLTIRVRYDLVELFMLVRKKKKEKTAFELGDTQKERLYPRNCHMLPAFLGDSSARGWLSIRNLSRWSGEVIDPLSSSFIGFPLLSGVVVGYIARLYHNGSASSSNTTRWACHQWSNKTKRMDSVGRKRTERLKRSWPFFVTLSSSIR